MTNPYFNEYIEQIGDLFEEKKKFCIDDDNNHGVLVMNGK